MQEIAAGSPAGLSPRYRSATWSWLPSLAPRPVRNKDLFQPNGPGFTLPHRLLRMSGGHAKPLMPAGYQTGRIRYWTSPVTARQAENQIRFSPDSRRYPTRGKGLPRMSKELLINGGHVVTVDPDLGDLTEGDVLVADGVIAAVGKDLKPATAEAEVIDAAGRLVNSRQAAGYRLRWRRGQAAWPVPPRCRRRAGSGPGGRGSSLSSAREQW